MSWRTIRHPRSAVQTSNAKFRRPKVRQHETEPTAPPPSLSMVSTSRWHPSGWAISSQRNHGPTQQRHVIKCLPRPYVAGLLHVQRVSRAESAPDVRRPTCHMSMNEISFRQSLRATWLVMCFQNTLRQRLLLESMIRSRDDCRIWCQRLLRRFAELASPDWLYVAPAQNYWSPPGQRYSLWWKLVSALLTVRHIDDGEMHRDMCPEPRTNIAGDW